MHLNGSLNFACVFPCGNMFSHLNFQELLFFFFWGGGGERRGIEGVGVTPLDPRW